MGQNNIILLVPNLIFTNQTNLTTLKQNLIPEKDEAQNIKEIFKKATKFAFQKIFLL